MRHFLHPFGSRFLADRGFASRAMYLFLRALQIDFVIRTQVLALIGSSDEMQPAAPAHSQTWTHLYHFCAHHFGARRGSTLIVLKHAKGMKESWCLASAEPISNRRVVNLYGRRFTIEERFRDIKDWRFRNGRLCGSDGVFSATGQATPYHRACADPPSHSGGRRRGAGNVATPQS